MDLRAKKTIKACNKKIKSENSEGPNEEKMWTRLIASNRDLQLRICLAGGQSFRLVYVYPNVSEYVDR